MKIGYVNLFLTTTPDGRAAPVFPGGAEVTVPDEGFVIDPAPAQSVIWVRDTNGAIVARVDGQAPGDGTEAYFEAFATINGGQEAGIAALADPAGGASTILNAFAGNPAGGEVQRLILDAAGQSNYLQLGVAGRSLMGLGTIHWNAGSQLSNVLTVSGLGFTPTKALAGLTATGLPQLGFLQAFNLGAGTFSVQGWATAAPAGAVDVPFCWLAAT